MSCWRSCQDKSVAASWIKDNIVGTIFAARSCFLKEILSPEVLDMYDQGYVCVQESYQNRKLIVDAYMEYGLDQYSPYINYYKMAGITSSVTDKNKNVLELRDRDIGRSSQQKSINDTSSSSSSSSSTVQTMNEQAEMQRLNSRFINYLKRLRELELTNDTLTKQLSDVRKSVSMDGSSVILQYDPELTNLRRQLDTLIHDKTLVELRINHFDYDIKRQKAKCDTYETRNDDIYKLEQELKQIKDEYNYLQSKIFNLQQIISKTKQEEEFLNHEIDKLLIEHENEIIARYDLQNEIQTLEESLTFKRALYEHELNALEKLLKQNNLTDDFYRNEFDRATKDLRNEYEQLHYQQISNLKEYYKQKQDELVETVRVMNNSLTTQSQSATSTIKTLETTKESVKMSKNDLSNLLDKNSDLSAKAQSLQEKYDEIKLYNRQQTFEQEKQIDQLRNDIEALATSHDQVMNSKTSMEFEILTYKRLLDNVEKLPLSQTTIIGSSNNQSTIATTTTTTRTITTKMVPVPSKQASSSKFSGKICLRMLPLYAAVAFIDAGSNEYYESRLPKHSCLNECYKHVGNYVLNAVNLTIPEIITFHADGTFNAINSFQDGNQYSTDPGDRPYSNEYNIWKCNGKNGIEAKSLDFAFPSLARPYYRAVEENTYSLKFDHDRFDGKAGYTAYKQNSLSQNQLSVPINGPFEFSVQGYKVFDLCEQKQHKKY
ncbi:unnamed protein product [Didymodactylos carnosus]|uniref:IF rod domain-containing protein n=1 Tax=Didymodactylos carnosus TaxID=1234261 RepID=A0A813QFS8_9BILA|nr:unnamed protein product [Didymodactylos carnosus]CAF0767147.1 unnamed protein product [Didymodactylos carnosus]CAF3492728.1 unnamed protein product [Didymodactylos carnosus]CAF3548762.1 unnamed protein product [Didymodactylos carnosus]